MARVSVASLGSLIVAISVIIMTFALVAQVRGYVAEEKVEEITPLNAYEEPWVGTCPWRDMLAFDKVTHIAGRAEVTDGVVYDLGNFTEYYEVAGYFNETKVWILFPLEYLDVYNRNVKSLSFTLQLTAASDIFVQLQGSGYYSDGALDPLTSLKQVGDDATVVNVSFTFDLGMVLNTIAEQTNSSVVVMIDILHAPGTPAPGVIILNATYTREISYVSGSTTLGILGGGLILLAVYSTERMSMSRTMRWIDRKTRRRR